MIDVVFCLQDNYAQHCAVVIASILENANNTNNFTFHILQTDMTESNKHKILLTTEQYNSKVFFYDLSNYDCSFLPVRAWPVSVYYLLLVYEVLDKSVDRCICLDCDVIVCEDLEKIYNYDISNYLIGAVEDDSSLINNVRLGLSNKHKYFNSGVLYMNLKKMRQVDFKQICFSYYENNKDKITLQDQDILNGACELSTLDLPLRYNLQPACFNDFYFGLTDYKREDVETAIKNPCIIHYSFRSKPWKVDCIHPLKDLYFKYLRKTPFAKHFELKLKIKRFFRYMFFMRNIGEYKHLFIFWIHIKILRKKNLFREMFELLEYRGRTSIK